jgi:ABC-type iron transport system FetAB ATPase subunit
MMKTDLLFSVKNLTYLANGPYSFELRENEVLGLTGASGIGKTQMLRALVEVIVHGGEVRLDGTPATAFSAPDWRKHVAFVPADSSWWHDTVGQHFPDYLQSQLHIKWLDYLGFQEDVFSWRVSRLSTGERQRLAIVRALINEPSVFLLDEPCSSLDERATSHVEKLLLDYKDRKNTALVWVSHDIDQLRRVASRCYRVQQTRLEKLFPIT